MALPPSPNSRSNTTRGWFSVEIRRRLVAPRNGIHVETVARVASTLRGRVDGELERAHGRARAEHIRGELVSRRRELHLDAGLRSIVSVHTREPGGRRARMVARAVAEVVGLRVVETADDREVLAQRRERPQHGRKLELRARPGRLEGLVDDAVTDVDEAEPRCPGRAVGGERRHHRVEQRQRERGSGAAQEGSTRQRLLAQERARFERHGSPPAVSTVGAAATVAAAAARPALIWNGTLATTPSTIAENS